MISYKRMIKYDKYNYISNMNNNNAEIKSKSESDSELDNINSDDFDDMSEPQTHSFDDSQANTIQSEQELNLDLDLDLDLKSDNSTESDLSLSESDQNHVQSLELTPNPNPKPESTPKPESESESESESKLRNPNVISKQKITLNVGGKKFHFNKNLLNHLGINYEKLYQTVKNNDIVYFLDRDSDYFSKIIEIIRQNGIEMTDIVRNMRSYSEQLISELCYYNLIDPTYRRHPKLKLPNVHREPRFGSKQEPRFGSKQEPRFGSKQEPRFGSKQEPRFGSKREPCSNSTDSIVKIIIQTKSFETLASTIKKSKYFENRLMNNSDSQICITDIDIDPKLFRYVLNLLRQTELYVTNIHIETALNKFGIMYDIIKNKKVLSNSESELASESNSNLDLDLDLDIILCHRPNNINPTIRQITELSEIFNSSVNVGDKKMLTGLYSDPNPDLDLDSEISTLNKTQLNLENWNIVTTDSELHFGSTSPRPSRSEVYRARQSVAGRARLAAPSGRPWPQPRLPAGAPRRGRL